MRLALRPLRKQHAAVGVDQRAGGDQQNRLGRAFHCYAPGGCR